VKEHPGRTLPADGYHRHGHNHGGNPHTHPNPHNHDSGDTGTSRRDFLRVLMGGALAGASVLELAFYRAAWARAAAPPGGQTLFDIQKAADGVFFAHARAQARVNCNAAIFVRSKDVVVVDAHSKPSAAASLIAQIKQQVTTKPVRYVVNTHFHWDHTQGNRAYREAGEKVDFIASKTTKQLLGDLGVARLKETLEEARINSAALRERAAKATSAAEKAFCAEQIRQLEGYQAELKDYAPELPSITFDKTYLLRDPLFDLHIEFHGHAHTAGDVFVLCPQQGALATGDAVHGYFPNIADGFPRLWPHTIDEVSRADFNHVLGGHGPLQTGRTVMLSQRNYIEELTEKVEAGKKAGQTLAEMQQRITLASLKSLQSNGYEAQLARTVKEMTPYFGNMPPLQKEVDSNVSDVYRNLDRV
jgi:glyoxylase-like metal-dependent hydrolase (beta-lactamase superfamily II)